MELPGSPANYEPRAEEAARKKWQQIKARIEYCRTMIEWCQDAVIVIDHSYNLLVRPLSPIAYEDSAVEDQAEQTTTDEFRIVEASMFLKHNGQPVEQQMMVGSGGASRRQNLRVYYFDPSEHEITVENAREQQTRNAKGGGIKLMSHGDQIQFVIY